ncbi:MULTISPECIES: Rv3654c family TadE-like protein [Mumia]|uniref:Rv3654c family TadE-like protein n=1 Tax=Mumia xiangluensis TaxID=1678900 RepID=A0ABW1QNZ0_9ACTN|nr:MULTISPECIES: Rv3654c family TadE-like protein [Mumia]
MATVYAATIAVLLAAACVVVLQVAAVARLQHHVSSAADLTAIAASQAAVSGADACGAARRIASANRTVLRECELRAAAATVVVERTARLWGRELSVRRTARAAPSDYVPAREGRR